MVHMPALLRRVQKLVSSSHIERQVSLLNSKQTLPPWTVRHFSFTDDCTAGESDDFSIQKADPNFSDNGGNRSPEGSEPIPSRTWRGSKPINQDTREYNRGSRSFPPRSDGNRGRPDEVDKTNKFSQPDIGFQGRKVGVFRGLGFSDAAVASVLEGFTSVLVMDKREIVCVIDFLVEFGVPRDEVDRIVQLYPRVLGFGVEDRLKPLVEELRGLGFSRREVRKEIVREPRILGMETGEFSRFLKLLESFKCREAIKERILEEGMLRACFEVKLRVDCLCGHGLIRRDALKVLWKEPRLITYDMEDIVKKIEFLVHRMKYGVDCLPDVPEYLGVNFDKQIVPRYNVVEYLKAKGAIGFEVGLKDLIKPTRLRFYNLYVKPYPECEKIYGRFSRNLEVKSRHPVGLWKIFKPQKFPNTDEDVKNMKSFMDSMG